jgi:flagellar basal body-associated protein FliL
MPILVMAILALIVFGLIGIMLLVAVVMEHSKPGRSAKLAASQPLNPGAAPSLKPNIDGPRGEDAPTENLSAKEKVHEHACP